MKLMRGNCLELMPALAPKSVDLILCDLPYGTTQNKWDSIIPLAPLWDEYRRLTKGVIALNAAQPFTTTLISFVPDLFRYEWIWEKSHGTGFLNSKKRPICKHESILVFGNLKIYNPQFTPKPVENQRKRGIGGGSNCYGSFLQIKEDKISDFSFPTSILKFNQVNRNGKEKTSHPTQKPVALMEYLIRTYTNEGNTVLDNCMGSGTTGVACLNTGRHFIGIEQDPNYFQIASNRIAEAQFQKALKDAEGLCKASH